MCLEAQISPFPCPLGAEIGPPTIFHGPPQLQLGPHLIRADEFSVLVDDRPTKGALEYDDRRQHEARPDLDQAQLRLFALALARCRTRLGSFSVFRILLVVFMCVLALVDLIASDPDLAVGQSEGHDMVDEGLAFPGALGNSEGVREEFFDQLQMRLCVEVGVEREDRPGALETVSGKVELIHSVN